VLIHVIFVPLLMRTIVSIVLYACHVQILISVGVQCGNIIALYGCSQHRIMSVSPLITVVLHQLVMSKVLGDLQDHIFRFLDHLLLLLHILHLLSLLLSSGTLLFCFKVHFRVNIAELNHRGIKLAIYFRFDKRFVEVARRLKLEWRSTRN
jgi:hypothetical protein